MFVGQPPTVDEEYVVPANSSRHDRGMKSKVEYRNVIETSARYHGSIRSTAALVNSTLKDLELFIEKNTSTSLKGMLGDHGIDISKLYIDRQRILDLKKEYEADVIADHQKEQSQLTCIKFDGRKDAKTLSAPGKHIREEHVTVISEPGSVYIDHFTPLNDKAASLADELYTLLLEKNSSSTLRVIGADGTNVNTGQKGGAIKILEDKLDAPLFWDICLLHFNELPFRHLFEFLDGKYKGPGIYEGPIGQAMAALSKKVPGNVVKFVSIDGKVPELPESFIKNLSYDQRYLYEVSHAIQNGSFPPSLVKRNPGTVHQARWVTSANNILRLYAQTLRPSASLRRLCIIILNFYAPCFFKIKQDYHITQGARNFYFALRLARDCMTGKEFEVAKKVFQFNSFFAHPEAIILSALVDRDLRIRKTAVNYILEDRRRRNDETSDTSRRLFKKPSVNFKASSYLELTDFSKVDITYITEPPLTFDIPQEDLHNCYQGINLKLPDIPCHSQNVERAVAATTEAAENAIGQAKRHAHILQTTKSRQSLPTNATKKQFMEK